jgi:hypothetical protein
LWKKADIYKIKEDLTIFNTFVALALDIWQEFFRVVFVIGANFFHIFLVSLSDFPLYFLLPVHVFFLFSLSWDRNVESMWQLYKTP